MKKLLRCTISQKNSLEIKSSELYEINQNLEKLVFERTIKLTEALKYAEDTVKIKDIFLSNMSHEIRTPS